MKHFSKISSLSELKKSYRNLAIANHPDKGGDTATMQEINAEFDALFLIWSKTSERETAHADPANKKETKETASGYRRNFYTQNGWQGTRYDINLSTKEIASRIREYVKKQWSQYKFSVRCEYYSGGSSIHLMLVSGPEAAFIEGTREYKNGYISSCRGLKDDCITEIVKHVMSDACDYMNSYNYNDSDAMIDYFDTNFYTDIRIGDYDKPYEIKATKKARVEKGVSEEIKQANTPNAMRVFEIVDYSDKAIAVFGDTSEIKDELYAAGGRFNYSLKYNDSKKAGWIFSKKKTDQIKKLLESKKIRS